MSGPHPACHASRERDSYKEQEQQGKQVPLTAVGGVFCGAPGLGAEVVGWSTLPLPGGQLLLLLLSHFSHVRLCATP